MKPDKQVQPIWHPKLAASTSQTPRTDAMMRPWVYDAEGNPYQAPFVMEHKAAELERELAAERAKVAELVEAAERAEKKLFNYNGATIAGGDEFITTGEIEALRAALARAKEASK